MSTELLREESTEKTIAFVNTSSDTENSPTVLSFEEIHVDIVTDDTQVDINNCEVENPNSELCDIPQKPTSTHDDVDKFRYNGAVYLGSSNVNAPMSRPEAARTMQILKSGSSEDTSFNQTIHILLSRDSTGDLQLIEANTNSILCSYPIRTILFCSRGTEDTVRDCFTFTVSHKSDGSEAFQCHVIKMLDTSGPSLLVRAFSSAFNDGETKPNPRKLLANKLPPIGTKLSYSYDLTLQVREDLKGDGSWNKIPFEKDVFKLQIGAQRKFKIKLSKREYSHINESGLFDIKIEKCFGMIIYLNETTNDNTQEFSYTDSSDFNTTPSSTTTTADSNINSPLINTNNLSPQCLLDVRSSFYNTAGIFTIEADWPSEIPQFDCFLEETPRNKLVSLTVVTDLIMDLVTEPVRFTKIFSVRFVRPDLSSTFNTLFSSIRGKFSRESYTLILTPSEKEKSKFDVANCEVMKQESSRARSSTDTERMKNIPLSNSEESLREKIMKQEPLMSGSGVVCTEISDEVLDDWRVLLDRWNWKEKERPKQLIKLVRKGIPEKYRVLVWQMLTQVLDDKELSEIYRLLMVQHEGNIDPVIEWDIKRTFTAHEFFRDKTNHKLLLNLSTAYSLYDKEIGYCQGFSFIMAVLLLHFPEEQSFAVLVKIMCEYELREVFKPGLQILQMKFYQLDCAIEEYLPGISQHFKDIGLETHMYASQWFLTVFAAKFPLNLAYRVFDIFLAEGLDQTMFSFALALLKDSQRELLSLGFESILQFFRATLPIKYLDNAACQHLVDLATNSMRISLKKLKKYERDYSAVNLEKDTVEDPTQKLERQSRQLREENGWLHQENDKLAKELVDSKVKLRDEMDLLEDKLDKKSKDIGQCHVTIRELRTELSSTVTDLQERESHLATWIHRYEADKQQSEHTLAEYKDILARMDESHQAQIMDLKNQVIELKAQLAKTTTHNSTDSDLEQNIVNDADRLQEVEMELAKTKLELCESNCQINDLKLQITNLTEQSQYSIFKKQKKSTVSK
ncbi:Rab GTPase-activating protein 1-like isoform X3 [Oopsacas minuta]|uniref:Rab GTPase-activating protein 1-like isoform X3 n=1 Tax=Oopsacas minuta TaxID=111878 RepID=A0AAV7JFM7_9METZ|nr:Rab GTPase-activating protein 1-like isoform X3 [Oopsacas minuta]